MFPFTYNADVVGEGQELVLSQFQNKEKFLGFLGSILLPGQSVEDTLYAMQTQMYVENAVGDQLDVIGQYVGIERQGFNDATYRLFIYVLIAINNSQGTPDQIITIMLLIAQATNCLYIPYFDAAMSLQVNVNLTAYLASLPLSATNFITLIKRTIPAGVELYNISWYEDDAFGFFEDPTALGFGDLGDPSAGGKFASLI